MKRSAFPRRNDAFKKQRIQTNNVVETKPSCVLHIRGLDESLYPIDIAKFAIPFGRIRHMVYAKSKGQALLELEELSAAIEMVKYYENHPPGTKNRNYFIQFSKHEQLDNDHSDKNQAILDAIESANRQFSGSGDKQGSILRIFVEDMKHPVKLDSLYTIFSRYGEVQKIVTYTKHDRFGALIQMESPVSAQAAFTNLDGKNIYNGCCILRISISQMDKLILRYNNEKSRDYTNPNLPSGEDDYHFDDSTFDGGLLQRPGSMGNQGMGSASQSLMGMSGLGGQSMVGSAMLGIPNMGGAGIIGGAPMASLFNQTAAGLDLAQALSGATLNPTLNQALGLLVANGGLGVLNQLQAAPTLTNILGNNLVNPIGQAQMSLPFLQGSNLGDRNFQMDDSSRGNWGSNGSYRDDRNGDRRGNYDRGDTEVRGNYDGRGRDDRGGGQSSRILHVSRLNTEKVTTDVLFVLFGLYGNVMRVKILYKFKDKALVEMEDDHQANCALNNLRNCDLYGSKINVGFSKYDHIPLLKESVDEPWLTKDYSKSHLHRFRINNSKNHNNIFPPSSKLHLSNIPSTDLEEKLRNEFSKYGEIRHFEFSGKDARMAWVQYDSVSIAVEALVELHNMKLDETHHLRVSFAPIKNRKD